MSKKLAAPETIKDLPKGIVKQMLALATSGFGLVAALAWNEVVKEFVNTQIKPYFNGGTSLLSLIIYAILITTLAVVVTYQLSLFSVRLTGSEKEKEPIAKA
jgi:hypothetical protein